MRSRARSIALTLNFFALALFAAPSHGAIIFSDLGTGAPPAAVGGVPVTPFSTPQQAAIPDETSTSAILGNPLGEPVTLSVSALKLTVPDTWGTWSHGYEGPVFFIEENSVTVHLPFAPRAFYLYAEPNAFESFNVTATANDGTTSGPIPVDGLAGATGFGFSTDIVGQGIVSIRIDVDPDAEGFALAEFGIGAGTVTAHVPTLSEWGMLLFVGLLLLGALRQLARRRIA